MTENATATIATEASAPSPAALDDERLLVVSVSRRAGFHGTVRAALAEVAGTSFPDEAVGGHPEPAYRETVHRARRFLDRVLAPGAVDHLTADTLPDATALLCAAAGAEDRAPSTTLALLLVDAVAAGLSADPLAETVGGALAELAAAVPAKVRGDLSAYTVHVYDSAEQPPVRLGRPYAFKQLPDEPWLLAADVVCAFADFVQFRHPAETIRARSAPRRVLAAGLHSFLTARADDRWGLHYYTGSAVSGLIGELEAAAERSGNPVLRGTNEHALACGALARWQLDAAPFLIVVTNGMVDEFKGTLANLREARAQGFIVCAEADSDAWFPFQGTVHRAEDSREVLRARGLPVFHLDDPERLADDLAAAQAAYDAGKGPVVLLAEPDVLDAPFPDGFRLPEPAPAPSARARVEESALEPVLRLVNETPVRMLWQCGPLGAEERELTLAIAREAGIALADSLTRPGTVSQYHRGERVPEYLGTLGLMGTSSRVYDYVHREGRPRGRRDLALLFLAGRIPELATPFPPRVLERQMTVAQVTREQGHIAPYTDHPVVAEVSDFLRAVRAGLAVDPQVLELRRAALAESRESPSDALHRLPLRPMSPNYFFHQVAEVLGELINDHGYTYTGLFDVGRGGISAVRNLPRTGPGFSGWYGRALMGDALQAVPTVALTRDDNVLAFVGDGASALVPDIVPTLAQHAVMYGRRPAGNVSVFRLVDGGHSVIRTYREARAAAVADRQTQVLHLLEPEWSRSFGPLTVTHRHLTDVPREELAERLLTRGRVDFYSVDLAHNNEGDGMSPAGGLGWQRDTLPELAFTAERAARRAAR